MSEQTVPHAHLDPLHLTIHCTPAPDGWGFVGRVMIADHECYRTLRAYAVPTDALRAAQVLVGDALGTLLAGQEWRALGEHVGHAPTRDDLQFGLKFASRPERPGSGSPAGPVRTARSPAPGRGPR